MKAEINVENKERFFALYINQPVLADNIRKREVLDKSYNWRHKDFWLNLKPLSAILDEDAVEVAKMATHLHDKDSWSVVKIKDGKVYFKDSWHVGQFAYSDFFVRVNSFPISGYFQEKNGEIIHQGHFQFPLDAYDFLRSQGYALPFQGLSVEELIAAGWVKLIEP